MGGPDSAYLVKLGGSLLALPDLRQRLRDVTEQLPGHKLLLTGGGSLADAVRRRDALHHLSPQLCHDLALQAMTTNAAAVCQLDDEFQWQHAWPVVSSAAAADRPAVLRVLDSAACLKSAEAVSEKLPRTWRVTSDTIAAFLACDARCGLVLLKSVSLPEDVLTAANGGVCDKLGLLQQISAAGLVDSAFPDYGTRVASLCWCVLRDTNPHIERLW